MASLTGLGAIRPHRPCFRFDYSVLFSRRLFSLDPTLFLVVSPIVGRRADTSHYDFVYFFAAMSIIAPRIPWRRTEEPRDCWIFGRKLAGYRFWALPVVFQVVTGTSFRSWYTFSFVCTALSPLIFQKFSDVATAVLFRSFVVINIYFCHCKFSMCSILLKESFWILLYRTIS